MASPLVSITLSTYNVESYISESLECICTQTLKDIEIICIDDGSTDKTLSILNDYAKKDTRIKVIAKPKNEGLAVARNEALTIAKGKYVTFVDGDDLMDLSLFKKAASLAEANNSDMVIWDYAIFYTSNDLAVNSKSPSSLINFNVKDKVALLQRPAFTWIKLIKTEKAKELGIHFPEGLTRQDIPVHWHLMTMLDNISILPERLSFYRQQPQATTAQKGNTLFHLAYIMDIVKKYLDDANLYTQYKNEFLRQQLNLLFGMYDNINPLYKEEALEIIQQRVSNGHYLFLNTNNAIRKQAYYFYKSLQGHLPSKIIFGSWLILRRIYRKLKSL